MTHTSLVQGRQDPLRENYRRRPEEALITDQARAVGGKVDDPFHGFVNIGEQVDSKLRFGIHRAVGGFHDLPNPGDMLCAALAACLDSTLRMVANRLGLAIKRLEVSVCAEADVRGALRVDETVPVGFQRLECSVLIETANEADAERRTLLLNAAEHSCVVLRTLRGGVEVKTGFKGPAVASGAAI